MSLRWCNLLPFCTTYYFDDGSFMRRSSRESVTYWKLEKPVHVDFYFDRPRGFVYYLPKDITGDEREELIQRLETCCKRKRYKARLGS
jgi:hypothetical protein